MKSTVFMDNAFKKRTACELSLAQLVWFLVVEPVHPGSSSRLGMGARIFLNFSGFNRRYAFSGR